MRDVRSQLSYSNNIISFLIEGTVIFGIHFPEHSELWKAIACILTLLVQYDKLLCDKEMNADS